ncbi:MAG TPA: hypothetical protein VMF11_01960 [Candidatus Baltobacteraceae bacterium]|nr:hypothetical protein [Candidatus Baltobacteraceae bacterium]
MTKETAKRVIPAMAVALIIFVCAHDATSLSLWADGFGAGYLQEFLWHTIPWSLGIIVLAYAAWSYFQNR